VFFPVPSQCTQLDLDIDRTKPSNNRFPLDELFQTSTGPTWLGYVNDFNQFWSHYQVNMQAMNSSPTAEQISQLKVRMSKGHMIPLGSFIKVTMRRPDRVIAL